LLENCQVCPRGGDVQANLLGQLISVQRCTGDLQVFEEPAP
jgi:hypothetical protein